MRGVQCFMPVKTGTPSSRSSAARVCSVIAFSGFELLDPEPPVALDEVVEELGRDRPAAADVRVVGGHVLEPLGRPVRHQHDGGAHDGRSPSRPSLRPLVHELDAAGAEPPGSSPGKTPWPRLKT